MDIYERLFGKNNNKLHIYHANFGDAIAEISAQGISSVVIDDESLWLRFVTHPQMREYTCQHMEVENGFASFKMYGVTFVYKREDK